MSLARCYQAGTFPVPFTTTRLSFQSGESPVKDTVQGQWTFPFVTQKVSDSGFISPEGESRADGKFEVSTAV